MALRIGLLALLWATSAQADPGDGSVRGFFLYPDGRPVPKAQVESAGYRSQTDAEGMFLAVLKPGEYIFYLTAPGYPVVKTVPVPVLAGQQSEFMVILSGGGEPWVSLELPELAQVEVQTATVATATVSGQILTADKNQPIEGARVFARGSAQEARSDAAGQFILALPQGARTLTVIHPRFSTKTVKVTAPQSLQIHLEPRAVALAEMVITAPKLEGGTVFVLEERRESAAVADVLGADQMKKSGDSDAASALGRVTGITVVNRRYVYIRGVGDRYSSSLLNGSPLPSPDPEKRVVPLDLFPAGIISSILVQKTYSADLPGEFGAGVVDIRTRDLPEAFTLNIGASLGYRHRTTLRQGESYPGSSTDFLTFGAGARALPERFKEVSQDNLITEGDRFNPGLTAELLEELGESFDSRHAIEPDTLSPQLGLSLDVGDTFKIWGKRSGYLLGLSWDNSYFRKRSDFASWAVSEGKLSRRDNFDIHDTQQEAALSALGTWGLDWSENQKIRLTISMNRIAENSARISAGYLEEDNAQVQISRAWWIEQMLLNNQLRGEHALGPGQLLWRYQLGVATRDEPNRREIRYDQDDNVDGYVFSSKPSGNQRFYSTLLDLNHDFAADYKLPLGGHQVQGGLALGLKDRAVGARRLRFASIDTAELRTRGPNAIFTPETISPTGFQLEEVTLPDDNYDAQQAVGAGYLQGELALGDSLKILAGARLEYSSIQLKTRTPLQTKNDAAVTTNFSNLDLMPSLSATWAFAEKMQLRLAAARTVNRPNFRELSPARFFDITTRTEFRGNPELRRAVLNHLDLRWEWYPSDTESVSLAAFAKYIQDPVENGAQGGANLVFIPQNVAGARNLGVELETRKHFGFLADWGEDLYLAANLTWVASRVDLGDLAGVLTSSERALQGQSPYALNVQLGYDSLQADRSVVVQLGVFGRRIETVGAQGAPDIYAEPVPLLAVVGRQKLGRFSLSLRLNNLLDPAVRLTVTEPATGEKKDYERFRRGREASLGLSVDLD